MRAVVLYEHGGMANFIYEENYRDPECGTDDVIVAVRPAPLTTTTYLPATACQASLSICRRSADWMPLVRSLRSARTSTTGRLAILYSLIRATVMVQACFGETVDGGLAEYARVPNHQLVSIPDNVSFAEAASLPVAYGTAHRMMVTRGEVTADDKVLILGASGGVGTVRFC